MKRVIINLSLALLFIAGSVFGLQIKIEGVGATKETALSNAFAAGKAPWVLPLTMAEAPTKVINPAG